MIISLSGLDGAGKSTQIARLTDGLRSRGLSVSTVTMFEQVSLSGRLQRLRPTPEPVAAAEDSGGDDRKPPPTYRHDKNDLSWPLFVVRMVVYVVDAMLLRLALARRAERHDVILCDRFIYDSLANLLALWDHALVRAYVRAVLAVAPAPDIAVLLDVEADEAHARKPEYPLPYMRDRNEAYRRLFFRLPRTRAVRANGGVNEMLRTIQEAVDES